MRDRRLRVHLPNTLARFGSKSAAELLLRCIETERDGLVRYKAMRGLGRIVADRRIPMDRVRVERLAYANLVEHFRLLGLRATFTAPPPDEASGPSTTRFLLVGLLDDKLRQSLERTFRLLKIAHPRDDFHRVQIATSRPTAGPVRMPASSSTRRCAGVISEPSGSCSSSWPTICPSSTAWRAARRCFIRRRRGPRRRP